MAFEKKVPEWNAAGIEPPASLKESGFTPGYKPPAEYFNWFWHTVSSCLEELHNMTPEDIGIGDTSLNSLSGTLSIEKGGTGKTTAPDAFTALARRDTLGSSNLVNADTLTTPGIHQVYFEGSAYNPADYNFPYAYGVLFVASTVSYVGQLFYAVSANKLWYRTRGTTSSPWGKWCKVYDTNNKPTLDELGAAAASTHNIKTYTNLSQLGLADGATMSQVARGLPGGSMLRIYVLTTANQGLAPTATNGWLEASRPSANHVEFRYTTTSRKNYHAVVLNVNTDNEQVSEWTEVANKDEVAPAGYADGGHDTVIAQGTSNGWTYRKWASGIAECWCTAYILTGNTEASKALPFPVVSGSPSVSPIYHTGMDWTVDCFLGIRLVGESAITIDASTAPTGEDYALSVIVNGRWK